MGSQLHASSVRFYPLASATGWLALTILLRISILHASSLRPIA
jgi:hypothetical protein